MITERNVFVKGNIIIKTEQFRYLNMTAYCTLDIPDGAQIIDGNLEIDNKNKNSSFTNYFATGRIISYNKGDVKMLYPSSFILTKFHLEIKKYKKLLSSSVVDEDLRLTFKKLIYIGCICALDAFIVDTFLSLIYSKKSFFENHLKTRKKTHQKKYLEGTEEQQKEVEEYIRYNIIEKFQGLSKDAKDTFETTLEITYPSTAEIEKHIPIRNDLVHRNGETKGGELIDISIDMLNVLFTDSIKFANAITKETKQFWENP